MALNGILSSALTALQTNTAALRVVSDNVANLNTQGYARRVVQEQTLTSAGQLAGVSVADVQRVADQFLDAEQLSASSSASQYSAQTDIYSQLNAMLGQPGDDTSLTSQLDNVFSAFSQAALSPTSSASQQGILSAFQNLTATVSTLSGTISTLRTQADQQVTTSVGSANTLIQQIYTLNQQIATATATGDTASGLLDQRSTALQSLSQLIDVRTSTMADGCVTVMTQDGTSLVGDTYAKLSYSGGTASGTYPAIQLQTINPSTGNPIGPAQDLNSHIQGGKIRGLLDMRDGSLASLQNELGNFAQQTALAFNAQHNANAAFPPPTSLTGHNTGLLSTDALNFTGKTTIAVADPSGKLVSRIDVDFGAGTLSVDGGSPVTIGSTIGSFTAALNTALGSNGSASFSNGVLSLSATGGNGIVTQDDATTPASRGGSGFSQFFGLNDILQSAAPSIAATGLSATDSSGFAAGQTISFNLQGPNGQIAKQASITTTAGMTIGGVIGALNSAMGGAATFTLGADGRISMATSASAAGYQLNITGDSTERGTTGLSFSQIFGLGTQQLDAQAQSFSVNPAIASQPSRIALAQANITASSVVGTSIVGAGDTRGLIALENVANANQTFQAVGSLSAQSSSLGDYANAIYQDVSTRSNDATNNQAAQTDRLTEATSRQSSVSGVNLDEELSNMMQYQQAYSAGARMLQTVQQLYDTLLQIQ